MGFSLESRASAALRSIARSEEVKAYILGNEPLRRTMLRAAARFTGGETLEECARVVREINGAGFAVTIDYMGESTRSEEMATDATEEFRRVIETITSEKLNSSVSLDLSHIGLSVDEELAFDNATGLAEAARKAGTEVMISMEGSERTAQILALHRRLCETFDNVGITLQDYLRRTPKDFEEVLRRPGRIRLVKGAYEEPPTVALTRGESLDGVYRSLMEKLLASGHACSVATHDSALLDHAHEFVKKHSLDTSFVEFEMLKGVTPERLGKMRDLGYRTRVYVPYGEESYLYLCHRLAEYPPNVYTALADALKT